MKKPRVLVSGFVVRRPVGGLAWHYLHYVVGLARLGYDVYYIEDSEDYPCCFNPAKRIDQNGADPNYVPATFDRLGIDPTFGLNFAGSVFARLGLANRWAYYDAHSFAWKGGCGDAIKRVIDSADLFLNVSHSITSLRPWHLQIPARALVDTDPVFAQVRHIHVPAWLDRPSNTLHFSRLERTTRQSAARLLSTDFPGGPPGNRSFWTSGLSLPHLLTATLRP